MKTNKVILFDMDDVLADFISPWISLYNKEYNDNLLPEHITDWNTTQFVKPECGKKIYDYLKTPGIFRNLSVRPYAQECIQNLIQKDFSIFIVSDSPQGHSFCDYQNNPLFVGNPADDKRKWLAEHFPMIKQENIIFTGQKWMISGDVIVDDKPATFLEFQKRNRHAVLIDQPYNRHIETPYRAFTLQEAEKMILDLTR